MKVLQAAAIEPIRLAAAVLLYMVVSPHLKDLVPGVPIVGETVAALLCACAVLALSWVILPLGRVVTEVERYANGRPYAGPDIDVTCRSHTPAVEQYGLRVRYEHLGLIARWVGARLARRGVELAFTINTDLLVLHSESFGADEERLDDGIVVALRDRPSATTWQFVTVSLDSREVPVHVDIDVATKLLYPNGRPWYSMFVWSASPVKRIKLMQGGNVS